MGRGRGRAQLAVSRREQAHSGVKEPNADFSYFPVLPGASPGRNDSISLKQFSGGAGVRRQRAPFPS